MGIRKNELIDIYDKLDFSYLDLTMDALDAELEAYSKMKAKGENGGILFPLFESKSSNII